MSCFKESIKSSQIKMNANPKNWVPTNQLLRTEKPEVGLDDYATFSKHVAPPNFKVSKIKKADYLIVKHGEPDSSLVPAMRHVLLEKKIQQEAMLTSQMQSGTISCTRAVIN